MEISRTALAAASIGLAGVCAPLTGPVYGADRAPDPALTLTIVIHDPNHWVTAADTRALDLVNDIYSRAGVPLRWSHDPRLHPDAPVLVITEGTAAPMGLRVDAFGVAASRADVARGGRAYVFHDRATLFAEERLVLPWVVLGCVIAHELGHLLLPPHAHTAWGVMRTDWHARNFADGATSVPEFPLEQAQLLRARVSRRLTKASAAHPRAPDTYACQHATRTTCRQPISDSDRRFGSDVVRNVQ